MKMMSFAPILGVLALSGCVAGGQDIEGDEEAGSNSEPAYFASKYKWSSTKIPVCWEGTPSNQARERAWVQDAIAKSWEAASAVDFVGWGACATGSKGVRIRVRDINPYTSGLGTQLNGQKPGMELNFTFNNWSRDCRDSSWRERCIRYIAVHEFGHALGFAHEQNRRDTPSSCKEDPQGGNGDTTIGGWDLNSVMNYCNPKWNNNGVLSSGDKTAVRKLYGE